MRYEPSNVKTPKNVAEGTRKLGFWKDVLLNKFSKPMVVIFLILFACFVVFSMAKGDMISPSLILIGLIGVTIVCGVIVYPKFGITILFISGYLLFLPGKFNVNFPLGTMLDLLQYLLIIGFFLKQKYDRNWVIFKDPLSISILVWILYNFAELANPQAVSPLAWLYTIRTSAFIILTYFIFIYQIRDASFIKFMIKLWLGLGLLNAADTFHQEIFGFFPFEAQWLYSDPLRVELLFQAGHMRKFGIFGDPVTFAYNMAAAAALCLALLFGPYKTYKKVILVCMACFFSLTMVFSGTRGAFPLIPAAIVLLAILKFNRQILIFSIIFGVFFVGLIFVPTSNSNIMRFQTAFRPNEDASYKARKINQARIKPFIQSHPIGGGLGATGTWGQRFAPGSFLANFPPDSGYVRVAVELGSIGILILCIMIFTALKTGINHYYMIKDPELKTFCLGMVMVVFVFNIGNFPQEAIAQYPSNIIFFFSIALINITKRIDDKRNLLNTQANGA
ncbi:O-antigen ligase [Mucilaginibacter gracilis]|uniref:O-antigen ligase n=1 Tax=Mucilaginibacter gracilis TaxID=423350 RepID=A0A495J9K9_9SPHI|nr:O-antigen ligase family protein [Mucilaginibacter gracilis]RKR85483.1 O-antigen ligase [Mucilaginibacter gracilis]